jgi:HD-GYP domain-containing protein (c-di-GMP phosphodiesterase class II)
MIEPRPNRATLTRAKAAETLADEARAGRLERDAVAAALKAVGSPPAKSSGPAGLSDREA